MKIIQEAVTEFPAVTVCNLNPFPMKNKLTTSSIWNYLVNIENKYSEGTGQECDKFSYASDSDINMYFPPSYIEDMDYYEDDGNGTDFNSTDNNRRRREVDSQDFLIFLDNLVDSDSSGSTHSLARRKRDNDKKMLGEESTDLTEEEIQGIRYICSSFYPYLMQIHGISLNETVHKFHKCPHLGDFKESVTWNPLCQFEVFKDNYGSYTYYLREYTENEEKDDDDGVVICSDCGCMPKGEMEELQRAEMNQEQMERMFSNSHTPDFSDVLGRFVPGGVDFMRYDRDVKEFVLTCSYDGWQCQARHFRKWTSDEFGQCYTFNSRRKMAMGGYRKPRTTSSVGPGNGLRLTLNLNTENYLSLLSPDIGVRVIVHNPRTLPFPEDEGFNVAPSISASIGVKRKLYKYLNSPEGSCSAARKDQSIHTIATCRKWCLEERFWNKCRCFQGQSPAYKELFKSHKRPKDQCSPFNVTQKLCMEFVKYAFLESIDDCGCVHPCSEMQYNSQVTTTFPNTKFYSVLQNMKKQQIGDDVCKGKVNSTVRLHVYLESLEYEQVEEIASYTWEILLCNVGGNFGLFIGLSLVSVAEFLELIFDLCSSCLSRRRRRRRSSSTHPGSSALMNGKRH